MICCWSAKGGTGTSVVAAALALLLARRPAGALLVDLRGDQPALLGVREPSGPGVGDWIVRGSDAPPDALGRLEVDVADGLRLLPRGSWDDPTADGVDDQVAILGPLLRSERRGVVVDAGCPPSPGEGMPPAAAVATRALTAAAVTSLLVTRPCYLALRRAVAVGVRPHGIVLVGEGGRALQPDDVAQVVGAPVVAEVRTDPAVARVVDAGLLVSRMPRVLEGALRELPGMVDVPR